MNGNVTNGSSTGSHPSHQTLESSSPNLALSPISTMGMSPVGMNPCSPMGMSPMGPHHHGYAAPVTPSSVHSAHPHNGGLSPMNDVKALCYGRSVYESGNYTFFSTMKKLQRLCRKILIFRKPDNNRN